MTVSNIERQSALNAYLSDYNNKRVGTSTRFWLVAHTKWGKELIGSVTPFNDGYNLFSGLDNTTYSSLDKLLIAFADTYFPQEVESTKENINGRRYYSLFGSLKTYDKVEILETGTLLSDIPGISE